MKQDIDPDRIKGTLLFIQRVSPERLAEFICNLQDAVDGLSANNQEYQREFRKVLEERAAESSTRTSTW